MRLPEGIEPAYFDQVFRLDHAAWRAAIGEVAALHGLKCDSVSAFTDGSNLVAEVDQQWVAKIFPTFHRHQWESERRALAQLGGKALPLEVPALVGAGTREDGWLYVIMKKLPGAPLSACWSQLGAQDRPRILEQIGQTMAAVHRLPLGELATLPPEWGAFIEGQKSNCRKRHVAFAVPSWFEQGLDELVRDWGPVHDPEDRVILTGEYTPFNLLAQQGTDGWRLTGMIDFGDAMVGPRDYDLLGPSMFSCRGEPELVAALFRGYFGEAPRMTREKRMRLTALAVLHRYAHFDVQLCIPGWRERVTSFEALAQLIWP